MAHRRLRPPSAEPMVATIADLTHEGRGVARVGGKTTFIDGALAGETVRFRHTQCRRHYDEGEVVEILTAAAERVMPFCPRFGVCGGCCLQHLAPSAQVAMKEEAMLATLAHIGQVEPESVLSPLLGPTQGYRRKARLGLRYVHKKGRLLVGFRERQGRYLADLAACPILAEPVGGLLQPLAAGLGSLTARERLPQIEVAIGDATATLALRHLDPLTASDRQALIALAQEFDIQLALQPGGPATIAPLWPESQPLWFIHPEGEIRLDFTPADFVQVNASINREMVSQALTLLDPQPTDRVLDLFCGLGNFTLPLARRAGQVVGVEGEGPMTARAAANAARNGLDRVTFYTADLAQPQADAPWLAQDYDLVLLDPPRTGAEAAIASLHRLRPRKLLYVSCHPGTLARDAQLLVQQQGYRLTAAGVMDMFPHTAHIESMALFMR